MKGPDGVQTTANYQYQIIGTGQFSITSVCKNPEVAIRWADGLFSLDSALRYIEAGRKGYEWRKGNPDKKDVHGKPVKWARIGDVEYAETQNVHYYQCGPSYRSRDYREFWAVPQDPYDPKGYELRLRLATELKTYIINENIAAFITGQKDLNKDWDSYIKDLDKMGLPRYLELCQKSYDAVYKK